MLFNSYTFIFIFLPTVLIGFFSIPAKYREKWSAVWLVLMSIIFYGYWDWHYVALLIFSICCNFFVGKKIFHSVTKKKLWLIFGISFNLILLFYFKYTGFFLDNVNNFFGQSFPVPEIILPLGISFFTFTQTAFLVDTFRGEVEQYSFSNYCLFVTIFPHLLAGPILYHKDIIPQFANFKNSTFNAKNFSEGLVFFVAGLFKKVAIADNLAPFANLAFAHTTELTCTDAWLGALIYSMQLYFDFSGYSEMAIGLGKMLNLNLPQNFDSPYQATSIIDFWRRWHMTLSQFVKNYIYIPLGGNRNGYLAKMKNLFVSMLIIGLWHGANWTFVLWGGLHGLFLIVNHTWNKFNFVLPKLLGWLITFVCAVSAWVVFRASNITDAIQFLSAMYKFRSFELNILKDNGIEMFSALILACLLAFFCRSVPRLVEKFQPNLRWAFAMSLAFISTLLLMADQISEFLYFQF